MDLVCAACGKERSPAADSDPRCSSCAEAGAPPWPRIAAREQATNVTYPWRRMTCRRCEEVTATGYVQPDGYTWWVCDCKSVLRIT